MTKLGRSTSLAATLALAAVLCVQAAAPGAAPPPAAGGKVLAVVNGEPITLGALDAARTSPPGGDDPVELLNRLVSIELVVQEARRMGLQDSLEVTDQLGIFERDTLRDGLFARRVESVKPDAKAIERLAAAMTIEVRIRSAVFPAREDAQALKDRAAKGEDFDAVAADLAGKGKGKVDPGTSFIRLSELRPEVQSAVVALQAGQLSPVYGIEEQFAVTRLVERRDAPDPGAKAKAEVEAVQRAQLIAMSAYVAELTKKYAKADEKLEASLDFDGNEPGFDAYLADSRALVTIEGEEPIRVSDLADAVRKRLFHGSGRAADKGRLNAKRVMVLDDLITKRVVLKEARRLGLDKKHEYVALRDQVERELIFGMFVGKVIEPEVKVSPEEVRRYYDEHLKEFMTPEMVRLESLAFQGRKAAEDGLVKLRNGAELGWLRVNAPGRLDPEAIPEGLRFPATPVIFTELPSGVQQALAGAQSGDYRVFASPEGPAAVLHVREKIAAAPQPLERVEREIRTKLSGEKRQAAFDKYARILREASEVRVLVTDEELRKLSPAGKSAT